MSGTGLYLRLLQHVRPYWRVFALGILGIVIVAATEPALPALLKPLLDGVFVEKDEADSPSTSPSSRCPGSATAW